MSERQRKRTTPAVQRRRDRVRELVLLDGYDDSAAIAAMLMEEGLLKSASESSALRLVQADRALIEDEQEGRRYWERRLWALRTFRHIAEDETEVSFEVVTPKGETVTMTRPKWPASIRERAVSGFSKEAEALARVSYIDVTGKGKSKRPDEKRQPFRGVVPIDLSELPEEEREAITKAMGQYPGAESEPN